MFPEVNRLKKCIQDRGEYFEDRDEYKDQKIENKVENTQVSLFLEHSSYV